MKRRAKVRGVRRRLKRLRMYVDEQTHSFPTTFHDGYWHNKIPIDQPFLLSVQENSRIQYAVIEAMMEGASRLVRLREEERNRVVVLLDLPTLWQSELLVFENDARLKVFMKRDSPDQTWTPLPLDDVFQQKLVASADVEVHRFHERIQDEDDIYTGEVWLLVQ
ncbi:MULTISPECIES: DUF3916 domain-containing protein [unclassified Exiguobacterium]|uniref:DUF3916 domain-containing protein n=1 Tax=unclassified Exiguobacterium TaxID=2644629 RepID=UPI00103A6F21|nr:MULTISPECIES: DUF3916 domain-containing protein [unclassified Exiguobacterium]TCI43469.1 DUF3916 domain-containing protein [Exiguobacterium sp. SH5S32]TCI52417.1 DUF3916 domain-containing protein [Exiguobacterium sp. SH1S4]TCI65181.1 DUF3916 domain-containing protein [Exiguobacterium sp. SH0S2]TCI68724.1 DUF3916 domain-containing protein [Exiguobacterium sp. SH1S1]